MTIYCNVCMHTLLQLSDYNEIKNAAEELSSKLKRIQSTLQRITAPNTYEGYIWKSKMKDTSGLM